MDRAEIWNVERASVMNEYAIAEVLYEYFIKVGLTSAQACGVVAQADAESGFNTQARGDGGEAHGLFQMHPDRIALIKAHGFDMTSPSALVQAEGVWWELQNSETEALGQLRASHSAYQAGHAMSVYYERPANEVEEANRRGNLAAKWFRYFNPGAKA